MQRKWVYVVFFFFPSLSPCLFLYVRLSVCLCVFSFVSLFLSLVVLLKDVPRIHVLLTSGNPTLP